MPYFIFIVTSTESNRKSATLVTAYANFREAQNEVKSLRKEQPLEENQIYKINFSPTEALAEKELTEHREEPIAKECEK